MKNEISETLFEELRRSKNYREFLKSYLQGRGLSLSDFARAAGFGRGFPGDVLSGKRRLTAKSYHPFEKALKLPLTGRKLFRALVAQEEPDIFPDLNSVEATNLLTSLREKPWVSSRRQVSEIESPGFEQLLKNHDVIAIYAAAGKPDTGASFQQIAERTRLPSASLEKSLQSLQTAGLLEKRGDLYFPRDLHLFLKTSDRSQLLANSFQAAVAKALQRMPAGIASDKEFFFTSQFCVREELVPELKKALRETILKFVDDSVEPDGDRVVRLLTALHF